MGDAEPTEPPMSSDIAPVETQRSYWVSTGYGLSRLYGLMHLEVLGSATHSGLSITCRSSCSPPSSTVITACHGR